MKLSMCNVVFFWKLYAFLACPLSFRMPRPSSFMPAPDESSKMETRRSHCLKPPSSPLVPSKLEVTAAGGSVDHQPPRSYHKAKSPSPMPMSTSKQTSRGNAPLKLMPRRMSADRQASCTNDIFRQNMHKVCSESFTASV